VVPLVFKTSLGAVRFPEGSTPSLLRQISRTPHRGSSANAFRSLISTPRERGAHRRGETHTLNVRRENLGVSSSLLQPDKLKLADLRLVQPQKVWVFGLDSKVEGLCVLFEEPASSGSQARERAWL
jgi:hypothetical protein